MSSVTIVPAGHPLGTSKDFVAHVASFNHAASVPATFSLDTDNHFLNVRAGAHESRGPENGS